MRGFTVSRARYARGMMAVQAPGKDGLKTRAGYLCEALKFRYSHRERSYIGSPAKVRKLEHLWDEGWDAGILGNLILPEGT